MAHPFRFRSKPYGQPLAEPEPDLDGREAQWAPGRGEDSDEAKIPAAFRKRFRPDGGLSSSGTGWCEDSGGCADSHTASCSSSSAPWQDTGAGWPGEASWSADAWSQPQNSWDDAAASEGPQQAGHRERPDCEGDASASASSGALDPTQSGAGLLWQVLQLRAQQNPLRQLAGGPSGTLQPQLAQQLLFQTMLRGQQQGPGLDQEDVSAAAAKLTGATPSGIANVVPTQCQEDQQAEVKRFTGRIKKFFGERHNGYGFIESPEARARYGYDVYIHARQIGNHQVGDDVSFTVVRNAKGEPQARGVISAEEARALRKRREREIMKTEQALQQKRQGLEAVGTGSIMSEEEAKRFQRALRSNRM